MALISISFPARDPLPTGRIGPCRGGMLGTREKAGSLKGAGPDKRYRSPAFYEETMQISALLANSAT